MTLDKKKTPYVIGNEQLASKVRKNNLEFHSDADVESIRRRIVSIKNKNEREEKLRFTNEYIERCARRFRVKKADAPRLSLGNSVKATAEFVKSGRAYIALASLFTVGVVSWFGHVLYTQNAESNERAFAQDCARNNFKHSANNVCYDDHRQVHLVNPDGTTKKGAMDWNVWRETEFADKVSNAK
jgi:hypothetical protein